MDRGETKKTHPPVGWSRSPPPAGVLNSLTYAGFIDRSIETSIRGAPFDARVCQTDVAAGT
jgi:hypothetical protein